MTALWALSLLWGCADPLPTATPCEGQHLDKPPPASTAAVQEALDGVRTDVYPYLSDLSITLTEADDEQDYFWAQPAFSTVSDPPRERDYRVYVNTRMYPNPPPWSAVFAILVHELKHIADYTEMDTGEVVEFGVWYAQGDIADYERATDLYALEQGCAVGLSAYRSWLYDHVDAETEQQKRIDYYTPEEIEAWQATAE